MNSENLKVNFLNSLSKKLEDVEIFSLEFNCANENGINFIDINLKGNYSSVKLIVHKNLTPEEALAYTPMDDEDFDISSFIKESGIDSFISEFIKDYVRLKTEESKVSLSKRNNDW